VRADDDQLAREVCPRKLADDVGRLEGRPHLVAHVQAHARRLPISCQTAQQPRVLTREREGGQRRESPARVEVHRRGVLHRVRFVRPDEDGERARLLQLAHEHRRAVEVVDDGREVCALRHDQRDAPLHARRHARHVLRPARAHVQQLALDHPVRPRRPRVGGDAQRASARLRDERGDGRPALPRRGHRERLAADVREAEPLHLFRGPLLGAARAGGAGQAAADAVCEHRDVLHVTPRGKDLADDARSLCVGGGRLRNDHGPERHGRGREQRQKQEQERNVG
jgi:hypothetical protein